MNEDVSYPPSKAIFKFLLKIGHNSHADNPPAIDVSFHILSSVKQFDDVRFSLEKKKENGHNYK